MDSSDYPKFGPMSMKQAFFKSSHCLQEMQDKQRSAAYFKIHDACERGFSSIEMTLPPGILREELEVQGYVLSSVGPVHNFKVSWEGDPEQENK